MSALYPHLSHILDEEKQLHIKAADPELALSPCDGAWWRTTKRMIERGSRAFWARRGFAPDVHDFNKLYPATTTTPTTTPTPPTHDPS